MFNDVDETLKQYLTAELPISGGELDVTFERPTREWSGRLSRPTLNCFLYDIRERRMFRNDEPQVSPLRDGFRRERPPMRIDLSYMITAWTREADDEHRILGRTLAAMYRASEIDGRFFQGVLQHSDYPVYARIETADHVAKPADIWGVLDNELRTSLVWVLTAPLEAFAPVEGPLVTTRELRFRATGESWEETTIQIAGTARRQGNTTVVVEGVEVTLDGTTMRATTGADGRFAFPGVPAGEHTLRYTSSDGKSGERVIAIPGSNYDIEL